MAFLMNSVAITFLVGLAIAPILILKVKGDYRFRRRGLVCFSVSFLLTFAITVMYTAWLEVSNTMLLSYYGFNLKASEMGAQYANVALSDMEHVQRLEASLFYGDWFLVALKTYLIYLPYLILVHFVAMMVENFTNKRGVSLFRMHKRKLRVVAG